MVAEHLTSEVIPDNYILTCSVSLSALQSIQNYFSSHPIVRRIHQVLSIFRRTIIFMWVQSHVGINGNEIADQLANTGILLKETQLKKIPSDVFVASNISMEIRNSKY